METKLFQYFSNTLSAAEVAEVEAWIDSSEENRRMAERIYLLCYAGDTLSAMSGVDSKAALGKVRGRIAASRRRVLWHRIASAAAMLLIPVAAIALWSIGGEKKVQESVQQVEMKTTSGMISSVTLPDGSKVWLNSNSCLRYPTRFEGERRVELVGEGYFDVARDEQHSFVVQTSTMEVEVLGTEFNIDAYERSGRDVRTTLVNGSINMSFEVGEGREQKVEVLPGQRVTINPDSKEWSVCNVNAVADASWKDGRIVFDKTPFREALRMIENRFNVEFVVKNPKFYEHNFTGMFTDQRLEVILEHFKRSSDMRFRTLGEYDANYREGGEVIEIY